jgi:hypothetical protein
MNSALKTNLALTIVISLFTVTVSATDIKYKASDIPADLITDAKAVIRSSETIFEITDINRAVLKVRYAITILNENGIRNSVLTEFYDKFLTVRKIESDLFDGNGVAIKNGANVEVLDYSANAGYSLYEDNRVKFLDPKYRTTPFTVEYSYETAFNGLFYYPEWSVYDDYNVSVEKSTFTIITPNGFKLRYLEKNIERKCTITTEKDKTKYTWIYENMPAIKSEPFGTSFKEYTPVVLSGPSDFEIGGYKGNLESWNNFGKWIYTLGKDRNVLDPETNEKVKNMISGLKTDKEKIRVLYNYLQNKVRYVSVQKGIGSWQTIEAEKVDRVSYGDCKALSNYMKSLLDVAGIKSFYTLAGAGESAPLINVDFPSNQFNHVILCIPVENDTLWLECTSQNIPFGYLGTFTDDRHVLLTAEEGGTLVKTKRYALGENKQIRNIIVTLGPDGSAVSTIRTEYRGTLYDRISAVLQMDETDKRQFIQSHTAINSFNLVGFSFSEEKNMIPAIIEDLKLRLPNLGTVMGNRIILKPNLMTVFDNLPYRTKDRKSEISIRRGYCKIDTVTYKIPFGYKIDQIPEKTVIVTRFGEYTSEILADNQGLKYTREFKLYGGTFPAVDYPEFVDFFERISVSDESKISIVKIL